MLKETVRVATAQVNAVVGDLEGNAVKVKAFVGEAARQGVDLIAFPELVVTGYPPEDLLHKPGFIKDNIRVLKRLAAGIGDIVAVVGFVDQAKKEIYNAAAVIHKGKVRGVCRKAFLPNYGVFDEKRYFAAGEASEVFGLGRTAFGVNICEDIWYLEGPTGIQATGGARLIVNINASPYHMGKGMLRERILKAQAKKHNVFISYTNLVGGQDELVFDGQSVLVGPQGRLIARAEAFEEQLLIVDLDLPAARPKKGRIFLKDTRASKSVLTRQVSCRPRERVEEVYGALVLGLRDYVVKNGFKKVVLGLSGGIDSSLVAAVASESIGAGNVVGVFMPSVYSSCASRQDAVALAANLGITLQEVSMQPVFERYLKDLHGVFDGRCADVTEENLQARIRGNIIMALSNKFGYLALNTGNKSEVSCGYCTLYGDMAGGFGVIKDVPKTLVYQLAEHINSQARKPLIPLRVLQKAPSAELRPNQKDSDTLPDYDLLDKILKLYVEEDRSVVEIVRRGLPRKAVLAVARMVDANEYKRRQSPPGIKITPKAFGRDRRMPMTNRYRDQGLCA